MNNERSNARRHRSRRPLTLLRPLIVLVTLVASATLVYLPPNPSPAIAFDLADATPPPIDEEATPAPGESVPSTAIPDPAEATAAPTEMPVPSADPATPEPATPEPVQSIEPSLEPSLAPSPSVSPFASFDPALAISISHVTAGRVPGAASEPRYLPPDEPLLDEPRFEVFRLRFEIANATDADVALTPSLEWSPAAADAFQAVPAAAPLPGVPFYAAPEWVDAPQGGTQIGPSVANEPGQPPLVRAMGVNPLPALLVAAGQVQLIEFSVRATVDAAFLAAYEFRLSDAGTPLAGPAAQVVTADRPPLELSPGQQRGAPPEGAAAPQTAPRYMVVTSTQGFHAPAYDLDGATCAACHRSHSGGGPLLIDASTSVGQCLSCHDGTNAPDVASAFTGVPANDGATRSYFRHDPDSADTAYVTRPECVACHNPHDSTADVAVSGSNGWSPSGATAAAGGVSVTYSGGPVYALVQRTSLEYQLCLKCHSGYAALPSNTGQPLSRYALDKGIELNPVNGSYHPISAPGKNGTGAMAASLEGSSPYKLWNFAATDTVRCVNCHADARLVAAAEASGAPLAADASLSVHASPERGLLIAGYRDRVLKGSLDGYAAADFALCFVCHAEAPFRDTSGAPRSDTNFRYHGLHVSSDSLLNHGSDGTDIDRPGDGGGLAVCAECHFRIHSTAFPVYGQAAGPRLVDFAPNASGGLTPASWSVKTESAAGTCALKCHGQPHNYQY